MNISDFYTYIREIIEQYISKLSDSEIQEIREKYKSYNKNW